MKPEVDPAPAESEWRQTEFEQDKTTKGHSGYSFRGFRLEFINSDLSRFR
jgi:hypothetical protein